MKQIKTVYIDDELVKLTETYNFSFLINELLWKNFNAKKETSISELELQNKEKQLQQELKDLEVTKKQIIEQNLQKTDQQTIEKSIERKQENEIDWITEMKSWYKNQPQEVQDQINNMVIKTKCKLHVAIEPLYKKFLLGKQ